MQIFEQKFIHSPICRCNYWTKIHSFNIKLSEIGNCLTNEKSFQIALGSDRSVSTHTPQGTARHPSPAQCTTQRPPDTHAMLSIHCPVQDTPWVPWDPISGFPTAGFSCLREGQPQAVTPTQWQAQKPVPEDMRTYITATIPSHLVIVAMFDIAMFWSVEFFCLRNFTNKLQLWTKIHSFIHSFFNKAEEFLRRSPLSSNWFIQFRFPYRKANIVFQNSNI